VGARMTPIFIAIAGALLLIINSTFIVNEQELAVRTQLSRIVDSRYQPGLHFKTPFIDTVTKFDRRVLTRKFEGETFLTKENQGLMVDFYIKWQIKEAGKYFQATRGVEDVAAQRISDIVKDGIKNAVAQLTLKEIVISDRSAVTGGMIGRASTTLQELGITLVDVRVQRIDLQDDVATSVYESMKQSFAAIARQRRGEGSKQAQTIRAEADRRKTELLARSQSDALRLRGEGDAAAANIYAAAFNKNPQFYSFYRSLQAYKNSLGREGDVLVIAPDGEFFRYLKNPNSGAR
jgi:membrane protease subunit HflC